ncbi:MAG: hypothetical protein JWN31_685 [Frankiales bacterium]|nr:hypothetical protein [Frankiales bacterium]
MSPSRHRAHAAAALLLSSALLSGCGVGLHAQTYQETGRGDGTSVDLESVLVRNLHIEPPTTGTEIPAGGDAVLTGTLASRGGATDTLTAVTSDAASTVVVRSSADVGSAGAQPVSVAAGAANSTWSAVLQGLTKPLRSGEYATVTLTFANAGQTTLRVPVHVGDANLANRETVQEPYGAGD